jgi:hypothetical protein
MFWLAAVGLSGTHLGEIDQFPQVAFESVRNYRLVDARYSKEESSLTDLRGLIIRRRSEEQG